MRPERNTAGLADAAERRHEQAVERACKAIRRLEEAGEPISFQSVARQAGVSRQFLYAVDPLRSEIERLRAARLESLGSAVPATQRASEAMKARNEMLLDENRRLRDEITGLRDELAAAWGELRAARRTNRRTGPGSATS